MQYFCILNAINLMQYFLLNAILLPAALFYHSGHSKLDHLEARGNHLQEMLPLKGP